MFVLDFSARLLERVRVMTLADASENRSYQNLLIQSRAMLFLKWWSFWSLCSPVVNSKCRNGLWKVIVLFVIHSRRNDHCHRTRPTAIQELLIDMTIRKNLYIHLKRTNLNGEMICLLYQVQYNSFSRCASEQESFVVSPDSNVYFSNYAAP